MFMFGSLLSHMCVFLFWDSTYLNTITFARRMHMCWTLLPMHIADSSRCSYTYINTYIYRFMYIHTSVGVAHIPNNYSRSRIIHAHSSMSNMHRRLLLIICIGDSFFRVHISKHEQICSCLAVSCVCLFVSCVCLFLCGSCFIYSSLVRYSAYLTYINVARTLKDIYVYIYMYVARTLEVIFLYIHVHIYVCTHIYIYIYLYTYMDTHAHTHARTQRVAKINEELCQDKNVLQNQLQHTRLELERVRAEAETAANGQETWDHEKNVLMQRVRELEARCEAAGVAENSADDSAVRRVLCVCECVCVRVCLCMRVRLRVSREIVLTTLLCLRYCMCVYMYVDESTGVEKNNFICNTRDDSAVRHFFVCMYVSYRVLEFMHAYGFCIHASYTYSCMSPLGRGCAEVNVHIRQYTCIHIHIYAYICIYVCIYT